jgi:hypothetical protein
MSGGHFDYNNFRISEIADVIDELILHNTTTNDSGYSNNYPEDIIKHFNHVAYMLRIASIYANNIDLLVCSDIGEKTFETRLNDELAELNKIHRVPPPPNTIRERYIWVLMGGEDGGEAYIYDCYDCFEDIEKKMENEKFSRDSTREAFWTKPMASTLEWRRADKRTLR